MKNETIKDLVIILVFMVIGATLLNVAHSKASKWFEENTAYSQEDKTLKYIAE